MSDNLAKKLTPAASIPKLIPGNDPPPAGGAAQEFGEVRLAADGAFVVRTASGEHRAKRAVSCLVEPEVNDRVLIAFEAGGPAFVLAVLEREAGAAATLSHDGAVNIRAGRGRLAMAAPEGVSLIAGQDVSVVAGSVNMTAAEGELSIDRLTVLSSLVRAEIGKAKVFGESVDTLVGRVTQRVKRAFRFVEEIDQLKTKRIDYTASQVAQIHAGNAVVSAEELVKVDGEQIHLG
jgi:hypothetical protein